MMMKKLTFATLLAMGMTAAAMAQQLTTWVTAGPAFDSAANAAEKLVAAAPQPNPAPAATERAGHAGAARR